jgi:ATP-dependent RNA helicase TDRD9
MMESEDGAKAGTSKLDELDGMSYDIMEDNQKTAIHEIYRSFEFNRPYAKLPILASKDEILMAISENPVIILQGDTGCGKTTQVPQYILDECYRKQTDCNIVVTQPRKIAAISNGKRVAFERNCNVGTLVGYQVGLKAKYDEQTRILYCTTGVLLQKLISSKTMKAYTHVILDEVHDRDDDMDFLIILVRMLLLRNSKHIKIILMSATIDASRFAKYFELPIPNKSKDSEKLPASIIYVDQRRQFEVCEFYYDDLKTILPVS